MSADIIINTHDDSLDDVVGMLRRLADNIEKGNLGTVDAAIVVIPVLRDYPRVYQFGDIEWRNDPCIQLDLAKHWLLLNLVDVP